MKNRKKFLQGVFFVVGFLLVAPSAYGQPKNIFLFIGDGMGYEQMRAAGMYQSGLDNASSLSFVNFPNQAEVSTNSADSLVTDSAAAATAIATGVKVNNGVISMNYPGDGSEITTLLEHFKAKGKSVGLVSTAFMTHATPAAFGAHEPSRTNYNQIALDYLQQTKPHILFGGGANGMTPEAAMSEGYAVVEDLTELNGLATESVTMVSGQFGSSHLPYEYDGIEGLPSLTEMVHTGLAVLDNDPDGFFVMIEGGRIDHAGHDNNLQRNIHETLEFSNAVQAAMDWAQGRNDTLILVTADHETGGLTILKNNGIGQYPEVSWSTTGHTGVDVPIFAWGENAQMVGGLMDNTDIVGVCTGTFEASIPDPADGSVDISATKILSWQPGTAALSHNLYFGTSTPPAFVGNISGSVFDPGPLQDGTTYYWRVDEVNSTGTIIGEVWSFTTKAGGAVPVDYFAGGEIMVRGLLSGTYLDTHASDDAYQTITEIKTKGKPADRSSSLEHKWTFDVSDGTSVTFYLEAHHSINNENDNFIFAYSTDDINYTDMLSVTKVEDDNSFQTYELPATTSGTVYIRVSDSDQTKGNLLFDTIFVDQMFIKTSTLISPAEQAFNPQPVDGSVEVSPNVILSWSPGAGSQWHDVYLGTDPGSIVPVSLGQNSNSYSPGFLAENSDYYWRIDEGNDYYGLTTGVVWSFTTGLACVPTTMTVDLTECGTLKGARGSVFGLCVSTVIDNCAGAVSDASVTGHFTGDFSSEPPQTVQTDLLGKAKFQTTMQVKKPLPFGFIVDNVAKNDMTWLP